MRLLILQKSTGGFKQKPLSETCERVKIDPTTKKAIIDPATKSFVMETVPLPIPTVLGSGRIYEGATAPTEAQMEALFAPTYKVLRERAYADPANACSVYDLADAETKLASPDSAVQAAGAAQKAAALAKRLAIKAQFPKSHLV